MINDQVRFGMPNRYRLLDGAHRWSAYKLTGIAQVEVLIKNLNGNDPLLYAAKKSIGPRQLNEDEAHIKIFRMNRLGIPQNRIAKRLR